MNKRIEKLRSIMKEKDIEGLLISSTENRTYFSNFVGDEEAGYLLVTQDKEFILTDSRYTEQAKQQSDFEVVEYKISSVKTIKDLIEDFKIKRLGFEDHHLIYSKYNKIFEETRVQMIPLGERLFDIRAVKDNIEISKIKRACELGDRAFSQMLNIIKPGMTEKELSFELEFFLKKNGAEALSFDSVVATGARTSLPHARPTKAKINYGDFVLLDFGCVIDGYCSDMTRTIVVGKASDEQKKIYNIVLEAQLKALNFISKGKRGNEVDKIARNFITEKGYGNNFGHALGHGVGLFIHEEPRLSETYNKELQSGMVVTVEPGIYISDFGGVRIEDMVVITEDGAENLMKSPKELIEL